MTRPSSRSTRNEIAARAKPAQYQISWKNPVTNETVQIRIKHTHSYLVPGQDHVEVESIKPRKATLPITETGYRSHFIPALELFNAGGPVTFVTSWIEREAATKKWLATETVRAQGDLFSWANAAETSTEAAPKRAHGAEHSSPRPRRRVAPDPDYLADRELTDGQIRKRMAQRARGKEPKPPREP